MKALLILLISLNAFASNKFEVLTRKKAKSKPNIIMTELEDLISENSFNGKYFKIVQGQSDKAISFDANPKILFRAATTYYHATIARNYWVKTIKSEYAKNLEKIVIRIEHNSEYNELTHFAENDLNLQYNNALSIPSGETPDYVSFYKKWGHEIWFRPMKRILTKEIEGIGENPLETQLSLLYRPAKRMAWGNFEFSTLNALFNGSLTSPDYKQTVLRHAGTLLGMFIAVEGSKYLDPLFMEKYYYLDTALVPEIIYHEYAHIALSDEIAPTHSTGVVEGMADFFTMIINPQKRLMAPLKDINNAAAKNPYSNLAYHTHDETENAARGDFVLSYLWDIYNQINSPLEVIYASRKYLDSRKADIFDSLPRALLRGCEDKAKNISLCKRRVYRISSMKGL
jgi:hypothetical protein